FTPEEIARVLRLMPSGKGSDATKAYLELTISKALKETNSFLPTPPGKTPIESEEEWEEQAIIWAKDVPPPGEHDEIKSLWGSFLFPSSIHLTAGDSGIGKTTLNYNISVRLARGEPFAGLTPPRPLRILYYDLETPERLFRRKLHLISDNSP